MLYRAHEWLAERCRSVQFPRPRRRPVRGELAGAPSFIDQAFTLGLFAWLMAIIWAPVLLAIAVALIALLSPYPDAGAS